MPNRPLLTTLSFIGVIFVYSPAALAKRPPQPPRSERPNAKTPIDEFERMTLQQQQQALRELPPGQRKKLQDRLERFNQLPPNQQQTLRNLYNRLHELPASQQELVRKAISRLSEQPGDRQQAMRDELRSLAALSAEDRDARVASQEFRDTFSRREQDIVRGMLPVLPSR
jgi:hypothetical protein